jgi:selenide,water dikinase
MGPEALAQILRPLAGMVPPERQADLIVGLSEGDDAAVYRLNETTALIFTADFFTPVVDDPYTFGQIAAANSLSDIYATGGEPILALNLAAFPADMDKELIAQVFLGGATVASSAGCAVAGGHTILDKEPKFGMAVLGIAHPDRLLLKKGARAGDVLILTKALGTGIITTAAKAQDVQADWIEAAIGSMKTLNRDAMRAFLTAQARAATDITGFSLVGHALEIADKSSVNMEIDAKALRFLPGAFECVARKRIPGGAVRNRKAFETRVAFKGWSAEAVQEAFRTLVFAPETSGGLLGAVPPENADTCLGSLQDCGLEAAIIGRCLPVEGRASEIHFL